MSTAFESKHTANASKSKHTAKSKRTPGTRNVSEAKRAANARNGRLGGPKTPEGKARSRMNGLVHGLRAETLVLLPGEDAGEFRGRLDSWAGDLAPRTDVERYHFEKAVVASWRRDRCIRNETAVLTERVLDAVGPDPEVADAKARRLGARLTADPAAVAHRLRKTSAGCRWMLRRWDDLGETLDQAGFWEISRLRLALALLGFTAQEWRDEWQVTAVVVAYLSARRGRGTTADDVRYALGGKPAAMSPVEYEWEAEAIAGMATGNAEGRAGLKEIVAEARADLLERLEWVEAVEARRLATAADRAAFDDSAEGQRRQRYEAMHERTLRAALRDLRAEQERRMADEENAPTEPTKGIVPIAPTEPTGSGPIGESPVGGIACDDPEGSGPAGEGADHRVPGVGDSPAIPVVAEAPTEPTEGFRDAPSEPTAKPMAIAPTEPTGAGTIAGNRNDESRPGEPSGPCGLSGGVPGSPAEGRSIPAPGMAIEGRSELVGADDLAPLGGAQRPPGEQVDRVLDELHGAVAHRDVHPAGVPASRTEHILIGTTRCDARRVRPVGILAIGDVVDHVGQGAVRGQVDLEPRGVAPVREPAQVRVGGTLALEHLGGEDRVARPVRDVAEPNGPVL
jgi:hypothetical protein